MTLRRTPFRESVRARARRVERSAVRAEWRAAVMARADDRCEVVWDGACTVRATETHHILERAHGGKDTVDNGLAACRYCHHEGIHAHPAEAKRRGVLGSPTGRT